MEKFTRASVEKEAHVWARYQKKALTRALEVRGPLEVETREGPLTLPDNWHGYIALDTKGYPYPIAYDEFQAIYTGPLFNAKSDPQEVRSR